MVSVAVWGTNILSLLSRDFSWLFDPWLCYDPFWYEPLLWSLLLWSMWYDSLIWFLWYDSMIWYPSAIRLLWYDSVQFDMFCWIWYDVGYDMICSVLMPEFLFYSWRYHGRVIEAPMAWHFLWRCDWSTASPFVGYIMCTLGYYDMYDLLCRGGVWMHPRYVGFCVGWMWVCAYTSSRWRLATPFGT